jgi:two-component system CheB/CheR fusion protein
LERELEAAKRQLRSVIEDHEAAGEELRAANEEVLSANEGSRASTRLRRQGRVNPHEELITLNDELQTRNAALDELNNDLTNLFTSANLPVTMLGRDLRLRRFTPMAEKRLGVMATDIGRSILNIRLAVEVPDLEKLLEETLGTGGRRGRSGTGRGAGIPCRFGLIGPPSTRWTAPS